MNLSQLTSQTVHHKRPVEEPQEPVTPPRRGSASASQHNPFETTAVNFTPSTPDIAEKRRRLLLERQTMSQVAPMQIDAEPLHTDTTTDATGHVQTVHAFALNRMTSLNLDTAERIFHAIRYNDGADIHRLNEAFANMDIPIRFATGNTGRYFFRTQRTPATVFIAERLLALKHFADDRILQMISSKLTDVVIALLARQHLCGQDTRPEFLDLPAALLARLIACRRCYLDEPDTPVAPLNEDVFTCTLYYPPQLSMDDIRAFNAYIARPLTISRGN